MHTLRHIITVLLAVSILSGCSSPPSDETIKGDLIGRQIGEGRYTWKFESLSEFTAFSITNKVTQGDVIEYSVTAKLKGASGTDAAVDLRVVYRKESGAWKLANVRDAGALKDSLRGTPPDPSDIQKVMSAKAAQPSKGLIKVVRVENKGGHFDDNRNEITYRMDASVTIQFAGDCAYNGFVADPWDNNEMYFNRNKGRKGETKSIDVSITATKEVGGKRWDLYWDF